MSILLFIWDANGIMVSEDHAQKSPKELGYFLKLQQLCRVKKMNTTIRFSSPRITAHL